MAKAVTLALPRWRMRQASNLRSIRAHRRKRRWKRRAHVLALSLMDIRLELALLGGWLVAMGGWWWNQ